MHSKFSTKEEYLKRINIVIDYINNHLDEDIDLKKLASISHFSPFHFQRIMKAFLGEPLGSFIIRTRVETAAQLIRYTNLPLKDIAYRIGYNTPSSLSKIFKQYYGISPIDYRKNKKFTIIKPVRIMENLHLEPQVVSIKPQQIIYIQLFGDYNSLDYCGTWKKLWEYVKENVLFSSDIEHICINYDDPKVTEPDKLRTDCCLTISAHVLPKGEIGVKEMKGGKYLKVRYQGSYKKLGNVYDTIFKYIPDNHLSLRNSYSFEKYLNDPEKVKEEELLTELYIPIE
ncbi:AraC family transcriptional regulator [Apibacter raozihei]|uniref:AraC family transcriptional regulator n=1 Tax=Apibacter TaxID=1778601 RepID=UPI000FE34E05|nr:MULTISPECIES: AraC family transcriptional regulator [Apibacter]